MTCPAAACKWFLTGLQSCATASLPLQCHSDVPVQARTSESDSESGPWNPSDPNLKAQAGEVMAGGGGAAGPVPDVQHQPVGDVQAEIPTNRLIPCRKVKDINTGGLVV